jgi:cytochrome d ubiquinol oxidase subunit II
MMIAPLLGFLGAAMAIMCAYRNRPGRAFVASSLSMTGVILTAGFSMFPFIMPSSTDPNSSLTLWDASSSRMTLTVMFWAAAIFVPIILAYTTWTYRAMWGRVTVEQIRENTHSAY